MNYISLKDVELVYTVLRVQFVTSLKSDIPICQDIIRDILHLAADLIGLLIKGTTPCSIKVFGKLTQESGQQDNVNSRHILVALLIWVNVLLSL